MRLDADAGATVDIAPDAVIGEGTRVHARGEAVVRIASGAVLGERCVILAHERVEVGAGARLGDHVVLVDFDHSFDDVEVPVRLQPLRTAPVVVGAGAIIGPGVVVERGGRVAPGAIVLANTVVR